MSPAPSSTPQQFGHLCDQILGSGALDALASHQDDVVFFHPSRRDLAESRPKDTPGSVPLHRAADLLSGDKRELPRAGGEKQYHPLPVHRLAVTEDPLDPRRAHRLAQRPLSERR
jgi:hypothetical protein